MFCFPPEEIYSTTAVVNVTMLLMYFIFIGLFDRCSVYT